MSKATSWDGNKFIIAKINQQIAVSKNESYVFLLILLPVLFTKYGIENIAVIKNGMIVGHWYRNVNNK